MTKRIRTRSEAVDRGTPETRRKQQKGTVEKLLERGRICGIEMRAADEIERIYTVLCSRLFARQMRFGEYTDNSTSDFPEWFLEAYHKRYLPWTKELENRRKYSKYNELEVVYDIVIDGYSGNAVDRKHGFRTGVGVEILINGLRDYSKMGGWADRNTVREWEEGALRLSRMRRMPPRAA